MLRRVVARGSKEFRRSNSTSSQKVWSNFSKRSPSLKLSNEAINNNLFGKSTDGPGSMISHSRRAAYHSPNEIDSTFAMAYEILEQKAEDLYNQVEKLEQQLAQTKDEESIKQLKDQIDTLLIRAEIQNPEVMYNSSFNDPDSLDKTQPVYRKALEQKWKKYDLMVTMQRLEQLHVIPDTLPTLEPKCDVKIRFGHNSDSEFSHWIVPGEMLPTIAVSQPPTIKIQEFERVDGKNLYSVLLVNPDTPDLPANSFSTTLHYALANVPLDNVDNTIDPSKLLTKGEEYTLADFEPLVPEKNTPTQRACLWVFRQTKPLDIKPVARKHFDIRTFVQEQGLIPVGAHVWRQGFDRSVNQVREMYGLGKGRVFHRVRGIEPLPQ
ncbi:mitochondrial ribosomal protein MRPL35 [Spathaspora passalidarum NRRL Y-27907]|uniref:Large ribosomal subunit protein mL38 n=1 Tax=Spathaspora passalidarum (strain NRRL Y-27907 / 11-Y1) TaxID=619300 RepID=G3AMQ0_SPAPN|nr:mitochondrial ribosomal protein MRPL35 [Spathaspora passalidarum NRRL Y-27907]EGW33494.1 mitochondrial ribosomal protein MRPL35 [Spathaspora passalidarum NRRL Y-27907]